MKTHVITAAIAAAIYAQTPGLASAQNATARQACCTEYRGVWNGTGCNKLGSNLAAFRACYEKKTGMPYSKPAFVTLSSGRVVPRLTVYRHECCNQNGGSWSIAAGASDGTCSVQMSAAFKACVARRR